MLHVTGIPAFSDNYIWMLDDGQHALIIDPGDATPVFEALKKRQLSPLAILLTHHHNDHIGGVDKLLNEYPVPVYGPRDERITFLTDPVGEGDRVRLNELHLDFSVLEVPGHTRSHIAFYHDGNSALDRSLFCGDTLFAGGCGRLFEGTPKQMRHSLNKLMALPDNTAVYCAHEYTQANLKFALAVEPENQALQQRYQQVKAEREAQQCTIPSDLETEKATNPFLRSEQKTVRQAAESRAGETLTEPDQVFAVIRDWKNRF